MEQFDLVIIGGGATGLAAGISALESGVSKVLILERSEDLGGNLNLFIHKGFGKDLIGEDVTGPELATILINKYIDLGGEFKVNTQCLEVSKDKVITYVSPIDGICDINGSTILISSGIREKFTGNIHIPIHKYTGIFTLAAAHKLINFKGYLPGKEVVISGLNKWSLIFAQRLTIEGAKVKAIINNSQRPLKEWESEIINRYNIQIINNSTITEVSGVERIDTVGVKCINENTITEIKCDSLVLSVGYAKEKEMLRKADIELIEEGNKTTVEGIYYAGSIKSGFKGLFKSGLDGQLVGREISEYLKTHNY